MIESIAESLHFASKQPNSTRDDGIQGPNDASVQVHSIMPPWDCYPFKNQFLLQGIKIMIFIYF